MNECIVMTDLGLIQELDHGGIIVLLPYIESNLEQEIVIDRRTHRYPGILPELFETMFWHF